MIIEICLLVFLILFCILAHKIEKLEDTVNGKEAHFDSAYDFIKETKSLLSKIDHNEQNIIEINKVFNLLMKHFKICLVEVSEHLEIKKITKK